MVALRRTMDSPAKRLSLAMLLVAGIVPTISQHAPPQSAAAQAASGPAHITAPSRTFAELKPGRSEGIQLCQAIAPVASSRVARSHSAVQHMPVNVVGCESFTQYAQGEYVGRARTEHVPQYRLRVDDELELVYRLTREETTHPYEINVGDEIRIESFADPNLDRTLIVQPDGTVTMRLLGQVRATRHTVAELRDRLEESYKKFYKVPSITVTPIKVNTKLEDLRATVDSRAGVGGQGRRARVTPEGTIALPAVGSVPVQGLTLSEVKEELDQRYAEEVDGIEVTPVLAARAPRHVFVLGEVQNPGRYTLDGPTTIMQALAIAGSWNVGSNIEQVVVLRRTEDWRLVATMLNLRDAVLGRDVCPANEIWVSDSDLIIVPQSKIQLCNKWVEQLFTKGIYGVVPITGSVSYTNGSTL
jgi:polysaccharide export outer membrane protein